MVGPANNVLVRCFGCGQSLGWLDDPKPDIHYQFMCAVCPMIMSVVFGPQTPPPPLSFVQRLRRRVASWVAP